MSKRELDYGLTIKSTQAHDKEYLPEEDKARNKHARERANRDPENDDRREQDVTHALDFGSSNDHISNNLTR